MSLRSGLNNLPPLINAKLSLMYYTSRTISFSNFRVRRVCAAFPGRILPERSTYEDNAEDLSMLRSGLSYYTD